MKTLVVWGRGTAAQARRRAAGTEFLLWDQRGEEALREAGVPFTRASTLLTEEDRGAADEAAIAWTKAWGKRPIEDGKSFAQRLSWKGVSLWWFAELYLHHSTRGPARVRAVEHFFRVLERLRPEEVEAAGLEREEAVLLGRVCTVLGLLFEGPRSGGARALDTLRVSLRSRWNTLKALLGALKARLAGEPPAPPEGAATVLFLSHAAFWRERAGEGAEPLAFEHYFDRLIPAVGEEPGLHPYVVAVGPRRAFRRRGLAERWREWLRPHAAREPFVHVARFTGAGVVREVLSATRRLRAEWRRMRRLPAVAQGFAHRGVSFADFSSADLAGVLLLQLPWAVLAYEQTRALLRHVRPRVLGLYAESSGWGRAALAACAAEGVGSLALQHGILYPTYFSYRHEPDEADCPRPDRTAVFGEAARRFLIERGGYAPESLVLTGSPKFDELLERAARWDRAALRRRLGLPEDEPVLVVASRFRAIRDTHHAIGPAVPALARSVDALGARCLVKPHPAEPAEPYERALSEVRAQNTRVSSAADLMELLHAADALVTVESLSAVEALVLGRPVVVLEMPTHLRDLVEAGVAVGVAAGADPGPALWSVLRDPDTREQLERARERYLSELAMGVDGRATERILGLVRQMAGAAAAPPSATSRPGVVAS